MQAENTQRQRSSKPPPTRFLYCFPWVKSRRMRSQILRCFVAGTFLTVLLAVCKLSPPVPTSRRTFDELTMV